MKQLLTFFFAVTTLAATAQDASNPQKQIVQAQKGKRVTPAYFISGELNSADSFNRFLVMSIPELHLESFDSSDKTKWDITYTSKDKSLKITYFLGTELIMGRKKKTTKKRVLNNVEFRSDFNTLALLYKKFATSPETPEQIHGQLPMSGPLVYGYNDYVWNKNKYWFTLANFEGEGYCMLIRKI